MALSLYVIAAASAWTIAQGTKYLIAVGKSGDVRNFHHLHLSGNMPSAHSASVMALVVAVGWQDGMNTAVFAVSALLAAIVMYDAVMVRRSSGEQGEAIKALLDEQGSAVRAPRVARGHTPLEVAVGAVLGSGVSVIVMVFASNFS